MLPGVGGLKKTVVVTIIASLVIISDYITKQAIVQKVSLYERISVLPFLNIVHVENKGAAFGMFAGLGNHLFIGIGVLALLFIVFYLVKAPVGMETYGMALVFGGAAGNLIDRLTIGKVIDFIDIYINDWHWPAFNIADSALTVGISIFIIANVMAAQHQKEKT